MKNIGLYLKKELSRHGGDYFMLVLGGIFFLSALKLFQGQDRASLFIFVVFTFFYIYWGVRHHGKNRNLHPKNVLEYVLVALIILEFILILFSIK